MLALRIEYLTGRAVATAYQDRRVAEWPPHPARVFSALAATAAELDEADPEERRALQWLEEREPPTVRASDCSRRDVMTHFVPVNDAALPSGDVAKLAGKRLATAASVARRLLPEHRGKQPRTFPSVAPDDPVVWLVWDADCPDHVRRALAGLAARVVRIGHSSSLVACHVTDAAPDGGGWEPDPDGPLVLRVPGEGQLDALDAEFARHQGVEPRVLPCRFARYRTTARRPAAPIACSVFADDGWVVFRRVDGPRLPITRAVDVARALRGSLLVDRGGPVPPVVTGHADDGRPAERPHVAFVALPDVGHEHATGHLLGVAMVLPRELTSDERRAALATVGRWEQFRREELDDAELETPPLPLHLGRAGTWAIERVAWGAAPKGLREATWTGAARNWVTVTPIALDRNPGDLASRDVSEAEAACREAEESIAVACTRIGLPRPARVTIAPRSPLVGTEKAWRFPPFPPQEGRTRRVKVHAVLAFATPVTGPVLVGAGRYAGLGLCRPVHHVDR
jgi:CRISPR-associated protein Csb2